MRTYTLTFDDYLNVIRAARKLRKRGVELHVAVFIVKAEHWNKVKDFFQDNSKKIMVLVVE